MGLLELGEDSVEHFGGGFAGEGDGEDLAGVVDRVAGEELEETLDEEAGFTGAGGGFDEEGLRDVEGESSRGGVGDWSGDELE